MYVQIRKYKREGDLLPKWMRLWLIVSTIICIVDVMYTMLRPRTLKTGDLWWIAPGWNVYSDIDLRYADENDPLTCATGRLMLLEIFLNILALILAKYNSAHAITATFVSSCFVFEKTMVYMTTFIYPPQGSPRYLTDVHFVHEILVFWLPDLIWVFIPLFVIIKLWPQITAGLEIEQKDVLLDTNENQCDHKKRL